MSTKGRLINWIAQHKLVTSKEASAQAHNAFRLGVDHGTLEAGRRLIGQVNEES